MFAFLFAMLAQLFTMFARAYKRLPLGGKLSRKRLMRGDKSALMKDTLPTHPIHQTSAKPHFFRGSHRPTHQKLPCTSTAVLDCGDFLRSLGGGCRTGKFLVDWEVRGDKKCGFALVWWMGRD